MKRVAAAGVAVIGLLFLYAGTTQAGWVIHSRTSGFGEKPETEVSYFQRDRIRTEFGGGAHVMDFAARKIIMIETAEKKYSVMTFDEFKQMIRESVEASRKIIEEMKQSGISLPGISDRPKGKVTVSRISGATIAGYPCDGFRVSVGGEPQEDIWVTDRIDLMKEVGPAMWKEFADLSREMKKMGISSHDFEEVAEYRKIAESGYPMKIVTQGAGFVQEVTRVEKKTIADSLFEEPKGYEKVPFERLTYGSSGSMAPPGGMPSGQGQKVPRGAEPAGRDAPAGGVEGRAADYGKQTAEEAKDAASRGAQEPVEEKRGEVMDSIREGAREGIKKLFNW